MQQRFASRQYSVRDFEEWHTRDELQLSPKFQRRSVWDPKARSYLMDTIVRGKPIPKIFMRQQVNTKTRQTSREIVDGQQRLRTVIDFLNDGFSILKIHNDEVGGLLFGDLDEELQRNILSYEFTVDLLQDTPDDEVYEIFARLNTYSVKLNPQELRHAKYFGEFRTSVYKLAQEFVKFWEANKIFTPKNILRMEEAEHVSDILLTMHEGINAKDKRVLDSAYKTYDDNFPRRREHEKRFRQIIDDIGGIMGESFKDSILKSKRLSHPFFCSVYHMQFGLPSFEADRKQIPEKDFPKVRNSLAAIDEMFLRIKEENRGGTLSFLTGEQRKFYDAFNEHWVHADKRKILIRFICKNIVSSLKR